MSLLSLPGCSPRTHDLPASLADLRVEVVIEDRTERSANGSDVTRTSIHAEVRHARGGAIEREDLAITVNGVPLEFRVGMGNYYDRHPYYRLTDDSSLQVSPAMDYRCSLVLPDGSSHDIGTVSTPAALEITQFDFPLRLPADGSVTLTWRDLAQKAGVTVFRSTLRVDPDGSHVHVEGSANEPAALRRTIGPSWLRSRSGTWTMPATVLEPNEEGELSALGAQIEVTRDGTASSEFAPGSFLRAIRRVELRMECPAPDDLM